MANLKGFQRPKKSKKTPNSKVNGDKKLNLRTLKQLTKCTVGHVEEVYCLIKAGFNFCV